LRLRREISSISRGVARHRSVRAVKKRLLAHLSKLAIYHELGDSAAAAIEQLAIAEELENMAEVVNG
jgi:hypothetical protein